MITFSSSYQDFPINDFLKDFLSDDFSFYTEDLKKQSYQEFITEGKILGTSKSLNLSVLEFVHISENDPRISLSKEAFRIMANNRIRRGLVIFWNPKTKNWRLSLMTISLEIDEKNNIVRNYSNTRRYSFFLGERAKVRTPKMYLQDKGRVKNFDDLVSRFSVEVVNKAFYADIAKYFTKLVSGKNDEGDQLIFPVFSSEISKNSQEFAVRLIGRLVFCWFLKQKQGSDIPLIPENILSSKALDAYDNYYHDAVEPLFFELLNKDLDHRSREYKSEIFNNIPYLNGGLFSPHKLDYYSPQYTDSLHISNDWFRGFFSLLETYNFTIDENTLIDQELSVDPEMLGRIFENLLAEINPETGESARKSTGSFYTPREIVEYMVDESLISFLEIQTKIESNKLSALVSYDQDDDSKFPLTEEEKIKIISVLDNCRILDPACGSGAFPIGTLQKILYILQVIDPDGQKWFDCKLSGIDDEMMKDVIRSRFEEENLDYVRKLGIIKDTIFGVDIQPIAVEIAKLRCFLTLIVEERIDDTKRNRGIEPLPNLDFKFVCANSLISLSEDKGIFDIKNLDGKLKKIRDKYFDPKKSKEEKEKLKIEFRALIQNESLLSSDREKLIKTYDPFTPESCAGFFDSHFMLGVNKFDVVIGNPPYISYYSRQAKYLSEDIRKYYENNYLFLKNKKKKSINTTMLFLEKGLENCLNGGILTLIIDIGFFEKVYKEIREYLSKFDILEIVYNISDFENVASGQIIIRVCNRKVKEIKCNIKNYFQTENILNYDKFIGNTISFGNDRSHEGDGFTKLGKICDITSGLEYSSLKYLFLSPEKKNSNYHKVINGKELKEKYSHNWTTENGYVLFDKDFEKQLVNEGRNISQTGKTVFFVSGNKDKYLEEKIFIRQSAMSIIASLDENHIFCLRSLFLCNLKKSESYYSLKSILGILNSKYIEHYALNNGIIRHGNGKQPQIRVDGLKNLPIPMYSSSNSNKFDSITLNVNKILEKRLNDAEAVISDIEIEIDRLVYELYGVSNEEIDNIEGKS